MRKSIAFWDASALVPLCVRQSATAEATSHLRKLSPVVWWGSLVEIQSAICRLNRERAIPDEGKRAALGRLEILSRSWREILAGDNLRELALDLLSRYPLKSANALQVAASLIWCDERPARRAFVCADGKLSRVASLIGFEVIELR